MSNSLSQNGSPGLPANRQFQPWLAVLSVALSAAVFCSTEFLPVGLLRYISEGLGVSEGQAGLMVSVPGLLAALAAPLLTVLVGRHDRRHILCALGLLLAASNLIAMVAPNFGILLLGRVLFGIGLGGFWAIDAGLGARLVSEQSVGRATALIFAGVSIGMLIGGAAGALIGDMFGWRAAFGGAFGLSLLALLAQLAFLPPLRVEHQVRPRDLLGIVATPAGRVGLLAMTLALCGQFATYTYITPFLAQRAGFNGTAISSILLGYTLIGLVGNFLGGAGAGRNVKLTLSAAILFFMVPVMLLPLLGAAQVCALALMAIWGLAYGAMPIALQMWMMKAVSDTKEGGMALFVGDFQTSIALGSFGGGLVVDHFGLDSTMYFGAALGGLALLILWRKSHPSASITRS
ncbi:MFS transporter [Paraburkholderia sediminicola]|uniref:MFS transporter n=1 Tax=Paraburkholderia TaxID=1822464 RepID=UPI0038BB21C0